MLYKFPIILEILWNIALHPGLESRASPWEYMEYWWQYITFTVLIALKRFFSEDLEPQITNCLASTCSLL